MDSPDFRALFENAPSSVLVLNPHLTIVAVTERYLHATMTVREQILGRHVFDVFPDDPSDREANGEANLRASLHTVLLQKRPHRMPVQRYPIPHPTAPGGFEERFWAVLNAPILDGEGQVSCILHHAEDVTELVRLKHEKLAQDQNLFEIAKQTARYVKLLDSAPDATVVVSQDGRIQLVNAQAEKMFGYERSRLVGQALEILLPERFRGGHALHMSRFFVSPTTRPMGSRMELFARRHDGSELPVEVSLSPQPDGAEMSVSASIRDISERKRLEAAARLNADRLSSAVDTIEDAFALFDAEDKLVLCNSAYRRLFTDTPPKPLVGRSYQDLLELWMREIVFAGDDEPSLFRKERLLNRGQKQTSSFEVQLRDGRKLRVSDRRTPEGGIVKTIWDLTEDERRTSELLEARAAAEAASTAKSEFLSSMSHELRTPLNAILGFAQLMQRDRIQPLSSRHQERVAHVLTGGQHLLRLIDDVLDLARIEAGKLSLSIEPVGLDDVLQEVLGILQPIAERNQVQLTAEIEDATSLRILADRTRFAQVLMNLGSNAIKYNRAGGRVSFLVEPRDPQLRIAVVDDGLGIPYAKQHLLFQPFQRAGQETGVIEGTGIGLVTTKRLVTLMDGDIGFESEEGRGSTFWVDLPRILDDASRSNEVLAARPKRPAAGVSSAATLLYVEDNPANVSFMRDLIGTLTNIELVTVPTAEMGIELARARLPAAIVMDINLPNMSGLDALRILQTLPETRHIPVVALSAAASERERRQGIAAGFYSYLTKPVEVDELLKVIEDILVKRS